MSKLVMLIVCLLLLTPSTVCLAQSTPAQQVDAATQAQEHKDGLVRRPGMPRPVAEPLRPADYLSPDIPLGPKERQAVKMAQDWDHSSPGPIQAGGKLMFSYGAGIPTVVSAPNQISDIELQAGESVNEVVLGDSARWVCDIIKGGNTPHIVIKPLDAGLSTSAVITTDRRAYFVNLVSQRSGHTPHVAFLYPETMRLQAQKKAEADAKEKTWKTADAGGEPKDLSQLNFAYEIKGNAAWKPVQVFDDGKQMFLRLPPVVQSGDAPVLLARNGGQDTMVNFRMRNLTMVVDGVFPETYLLSGVGSKQERVTIRKAK